MIGIQTVYPCQNCGEEIPPTDAHCKFCGAKQDHTNALAYNLFSRFGRDGPFNLTYGGLILAQEDIEELVRQRNPNPTLEYFVGTYRLSAAIKNQSNHSATYHVENWYPVQDGHLGQDLGPRDVEVTYLE